MIFGMTTSTYTLIHVLISLVGIASGLIVFFGLILDKPLNGLTAIFLVTTVATSVTGFGFPFDHLLPSHKVGIISLVILAIAIPARYIFHMKRHWRAVYIITAGISLYLNAFVGVVQSFLKIPALKNLAPQQTEPPFAIAQLLVLLFFIVLITLALIRFHRSPTAAKTET